MPSSPDLASRRQLGRTDLSVAPLCLGGNVFGWTADEDASFAVLDAYVEAGGNMIDTADAYSQWVPGHVGGESERIVGEWMAARGNRDDLVIATKVAKLSTARGLAPQTIRRALEDSLRRLGTDHVDLYYAHEDDASVPVADVLGAFATAIAEGKVRYIAASNFSAGRLQESLATSAREGLPAYVAIQDEYHLMARSPYEQELAPVVAEHGLGSLPYYSLARGFLTGKYRPGAVIDSPRAAGAASYQGERGDRVLAALHDIADAHRTSVAAVALAWLLTRPGITAPIASARSVEQFRGLQAMGVVGLSVEEVAALADASAVTDASA